MDLDVVVLGRTDYEGECFVRGQLVALGENAGQLTDPLTRDHGLSEESLFACADDGAGGVERPTVLAHHDIAPALVTMWLVARTRPRSTRGT